MTLAGGSLAGRGLGAAVAGVAVTGVLVAVPGTAAADVMVPAPTRVVATAGDGSATVQWVWKPFMGAPPGTLTQYTLVVSPGGAAATTTDRTLTITGLTNGVEYTFRVAASTAGGTSGDSAPSNPVVPAEAGS